MADCRTPTQLPLVLVRQWVLASVLALVLNPTTYISMARHRICVCHNTLTTCLTTILCNRSCQE